MKAAVRNPKREIPKQARTAKTRKTAKRVSAVWCLGCLQVVLFVGCEKPHEHFELLRNGGQIVRAIKMHSESSGEWIYPSTSSGVVFTSSTDYFRWLSTNISLAIDMRSYGGRGLAPFDPIAGEFGPSNNAWCVVADVGRDAPDKMPVMFTRNLHIGRLNEPIPGAIRDEPPLGKIGVTVICKDGSSFNMNLARIPLFNPTGATNAVLRP